MVMAFSALRHLIHAHPLIDNHAHNLLSADAATDYAAYPFEQIVSEAHGSALRNARSALPLHRAAQQLAELYGTPSADWDQLVAARDRWVRRDYPGLVRQCLQGTHALLLDDLMTDSDVEPYSWHDRFTPAPTRRIVRIEAIAQQTLAQLPPVDEDSPAVVAAQFDAFRQRFQDQLAAAVADPAVVGFKSVVCYRTGLNVQPVDDAEAATYLLPAFARVLRTPGHRVEDKPLNDWIVRCLLTLLQDTAATSPQPVHKPLQLHTGLGDTDIDLVLANPAHLQPLIAQYPGVDFVLLHSAYPYTRQAGYLACCYDNVYLDLGEVFPMVSRDAQESILRESLELVPSTRLLWSTDGHFFPESFWLANRQFRAALERVLVEYVSEGDYTVEQARQAAANMLFHNSNRLYDLRETPIYRDGDTSKLSVGSNRSPAAALDAFLARNPHVRYVWMQWLDYTATVRVRMFPVAEFARIVQQQRRIGICLAVQWMLQDDLVAPEGSVTGQYYMTPDLDTLRVNAGLGDQPRSASVFSNWKSEAGAPLDGCPRNTLQRVVDQLRPFGTTATCGFEIEVVFLRDGPEYTPAVTNHSWSQMTPDTRRLLPILEEIAETCAAIDLPLQQFHAESAPGQFEFILPPAAPVAAVDALVSARQVVVQVAERHGLRATLHPRAVPGAAGTAAHAHLSLSPAEPDVEERFLAGMLAHYRALVAFSFSQDASYERVRPGLWAGSTWVAWGSQNRETPLRKIGPAHWEIKSLDGLANPYFAMAAVIAGGVLGLRGDYTLTSKDCLFDAATLTDTQRQDLGITTRLPTSLQESLDELEKDTALQEVLGKTVVENYLIVKRLEGKRLGAMDAETRRRWLIERY
ncbi:extracellular developmental signal biosynthesis protein FluG [Aspergillus candidus]|uniref:Glutamine synthetase n=1 Tax=Aspergillus candidus TaxID=41067 RepID=A0A2I2F2L5_ASPCN|nr:extracellular developmental signal biosynthesis protein FluG [Aspergillus candidus]PLB34836.1 extracellular developmental signal biosynthesis protein FluG [Aspergillus candidus]